MKQQMLEKEVATLKKQVVDLIDLNAELIVDKTEIKKALHEVLYEGEWTYGSHCLVEDIYNNIVV